MSEAIEGYGSSTGKLWLRESLKRVLENEDAMASLFSEDKVRCLWVCDECDAVIEDEDIADRHMTVLATGRVLVEGQEVGQTAILCDEHRPRQGAHQPYNCKRVRFYWPNKPEWNRE